MKSPLRSAIHDPDRLRAVRNSGLADTPAEECFDRLTRLASQAVGVPAAFLSVVDEGGDFYKSFFGFSGPLASTRRLTGETLCHHTIVASEVLVIDDVRKSTIYRRVPTVQTMGIMSYVGVPLRTAEGHLLGAFCVIDMQPRAWSGNELDTILVLARAAMREIEARTTLRVGTGRAPVVVTAPLSAREREVMNRLLAGQRLKQIGLELDISVKTVATHRARLMRKLELSNNRDLFRYGLEHGLLDWRGNTDSSHDGISATAFA